MYSQQHRNNQNRSHSDHQPASNQLASTKSLVQPQVQEGTTPQEVEKIQASGSNYPDVSMFTTNRPAPAARPRVQMKTKIGKAGDKYEQEADQVAQQVVQRIHTPENSTRQQIQTQLQPGTIQRFESNEHKAMGDQGSANDKGEAQKIKLADDLTITFGDMTAMAGDFFGSVDEIKNLAKVPGDGKNKAGTIDEIKYVLDVKVHKTKQDKDYGQDVINAVTKRYYTLAGNNVTHFTNPNAGDDKRTQEQKANAKGKDGKPINNAGSYRDNHLLAIEAATKAGKEGQSLNEALLYESFASHFLTDAYASGHMRTERQGIKDWWDQRVPTFWLNLRWWMAENIAKHLNDNSTLASTLTVQVLWEQARSTLNEVVTSKGIPDLTFGDAISGAVHDMDNEEGVMATVGDEVVKLVGDGQILDEKDRALVVGVDTAKKAVAGVKASMKDIYDAFEAGKAGESDGKKVAQSLKLSDGLFRAEQLWPKALPDSVPTQNNKTLNWRVDSAEDLFKDPRMKEALAHFAHEKADTLGAEISLDPPLKEEKTKAMQESVLDKLKSSPDEVVKVFRAIINYTPGSATGELGGVGGHDTDDNAVEYWQEVNKIDDKNKAVNKFDPTNPAIATLTLPQRQKLLKDVLDGVTVGEEVDMILSLLTTANSSQIKPLIDHVGWRRIWDKLWGDDCRKFIRHCGPTYWKSETFNSKKLEVQFLADGQTNDLAQETMIIILRTCTPQEVKDIDDQVGGFTGLSFDLVGKWDTEFQKLKSGE
jgi:hypothetical protein